MSQHPSLLGGWSLFPVSLHSPCSIVSLTGERACATARGSLGIRLGWPCCNWKGSRWRAVRQRAARDKGILRESDKEGRWIQACEYSLALNNRARRQRSGQPALALLWVEVVVTPVTIARRSTHFSHYPRTFPHLSIKSNGIYRAFCSSCGSCSWCIAIAAVYLEEYVILIAIFCKYS